MKANLPVSWEKLPEREKQAIADMLEREIKRRVDQEHARVQEVWIKLMCILEADVHNFDETQLLTTIASWTRLYSKIKRLNTNEEIDIWLEERLKKAFPTNGFPQMRIDHMKEIV